MPKEITHWHVAQAVLGRKIPVKLAGMIEKNPHLYYLGSVAHDIPFYDLTEPSKFSLERVGDMLHGVNGENTLYPMVSLLKRGASREIIEQGYLHSFLLGMLTHYVVDSSFHPFVYYLSGNYYALDSNQRAKAVFRHRLFETGLDVWLQTNNPLVYPVNLLKLARNSGKSGKNILTYLAEHYSMPQDKNFIFKFRTAWFNHCLMQALFSRSIPWKLLQMYKQLGHQGVEKIEALFYPQPFNTSFYELKVEWRHPVTGEISENSTSELYNKSIESVAALFNRIGDNPEDWPMILSQMDALSLDTGLPMTKVKDMKFFCPEAIEYKLRL